MSRSFVGREIIPEVDPFAGGASNPITVDATEFAGMFSPLRAILTSGLTMPDSVATAEITIMAKVADPLLAATAAIWKAKIAWRADAVTPLPAIVPIGSVRMESWKDTAAASWNVTVTANAGSDSYWSVNVTGQASTVILWSCITDFIIRTPIENTTATLNGAINNSTTSVVVSDGTLFKFHDVLWLESEEIYVTSISGNTLTVTRASNGTTAAAHSNGAIVYRRSGPAYITKGFTAEEVDTTETLIDVNDAAAFTAGWVIAIEAEMMTVSSIDVPNSQITVVRGVYGTTAAAHSDTSTISRII